MSRILPVLLVVVAAVGLCYGHGVDDHKYEAEARAETDIMAPISAARDFAVGLATHAQYLLAEEQLSVLHASNAHFILGDHAEGDMPDKHCSVGQRHLLALIESYDSPITFDVSKGYNQMSSAQMRYMPGEFGSVILKIDAGGQNSAFKHVTIDLETQYEAQWKITVPYVADAVTYVLMSFWNVPNDDCTHILMDLVQDDDRTVSHPAAMKIAAADMGELAVTILDENGRPCPAIVSLKSTATSALYRPANALVLDDQMDNIASPPQPDLRIFSHAHGKPYPFSMPGTYGGHYWFIPEPFDMAIPAGSWQIKIMRGHEYEQIIDAIDVVSGEKTKRTYRLKRWIDMPARGWYSGDDHIHSRLTSDADAHRLMTVLEASNLHVGNILKMGNSYRTFFEQRGFGKAYRYRKGDRVLVPGQEDPRYFHGHAIGLNLQDMVREEDRYLLNDWIADEIHAQGGLYGHAHVLFNIFNIIRDLALLMPQGKSDFGEILQSGLMDTELYYDFLNLGFKFTAATGSDMPCGHGAGESAIYVYLGPGGFDTDKWFREFKKGRCFITNGPMMTFTVDDTMPGDQIDINSPARMRVSVRAEGIAGTTAPATLQIVSQGAVIKEIRSSDRDAHSLELDFTTDTDFGCWIAAHAIAHNGARAHTTPVYIVRDGYRFWNVHEAPRVIARCYDVLDDMETELRDFLAQAQSGQTHASNVYAVKIARMAPEALTGIENVRELYRQLEQRLQEEIAARTAGSRQ